MQDVDGFILTTAHLTKSFFGFTAV
ncbi:MAG: hypothetical protein RLZZ452_1125, partial [Pseudomonadota bacterium]